MLARFFRFNDPRFWLIVALNVLNAALVWVMQTKPFTSAVILGIGVVALINAFLGMWLTVQLLRAPLKDSPTGQPNRADHVHETQKDDPG